MAKAIRKKGWVVEVEGLKELRKGLKTLEGDAAWRDDMKRAGQKAAEIVAEETRRRAHRGAFKHSEGSFRDSIKSVGTTTGGKVTFGGAKVPYGGIVEFGGSIPKRNRQGKTLVKPFRRSGYFIFPALKDKRDEAYAIYKHALDEIARKYFPDGF